MKIRSWLCSFLLVICGIMGAYTLTLQNFDNVTNAVSDDASVWDGKYADEVDDFDFEGVDTNNDNTDDTYYIYTAKGFSYFANRVKSDSFANKVIYLETDVDLAGNEWKPIGSHSVANEYSPFSGQFMGQGHTIYNLTIKTATNDTYVGLFAGLSGAKINALNIVNVNIDYAKENSYVGGLAGQVAGNTSLLSVKVTGNIKAVNAISVGGIAGNIQGSTNNSQITELESAYTPIETTFGKVASLCPYFSKVINRANVTGGTYVGGLSGSTNNLAIISESANYGTIQSESTAQKHVGGLVGSQNNSTKSCYIVIENSYNMGNIKIPNSGQNALTYAGGIIGYTSTSSNQNYFELRNVYNAGDFVLTGSNLTNINASGLVGFSANPTYFYSQQNGGTFSTHKYYIYSAFNIGNVVNEKGDAISNSGVTFREIINFSTNNTSSVEIEKDTVFYNADTISGSASDVEHATKTHHLDGKVTNIDFLNNSLKFNAKRDENGLLTDESATIWSINRNFNESLPYLSFMDESDFEDTDGDRYFAPWEGEGTIDSPFLIYTAEDLAYVADAYNWQSKANTEGLTDDEEILQELNEKLTKGQVYYFSLQNNINLASKAWEPIGISGQFINAVFDGNNHYITGINCSLQVEYGEAVGLFGTINNSIIRNLKIKDFRYIGTSESAAAKATLVGRMINSYIINCSDETGRSENTIGQIGIENGTDENKNSTSYIIYGENNNGAEKTNIKCPTETKQGGLVEGYLVGINLNDGTLYDKLGFETDANGRKVRKYSVHKGPAEFIITMESGESGSAFTLKDMSSLDSTYLTSLPTDTKIPDTTTSNDTSDNTSYTDAEINALVKEGFKVIGYSLENKESSKFDEKNDFNVGSSTLSDIASSDKDTINKLVENGIYAIFEKVNDIAYTIYTNSYETAVHANDDSNYNGINDEVTENINNLGQYFTISVPYNTFWSIAEFQTLLNQELATQTRQGYKIAGVWENFTDTAGSYEFSGNNLYEGTGSADGFFLNKEEDYFIEWEGNENYSIQLEVKDASNPETDTPYSDRFDFEDAILSVEFSYKSGSIVSESKSLNCKNLIDGNLFIDNYEMTSVDNKLQLKENSSSGAFPDEKIVITITLKDGFQFNYDAKTYFENSGILNLSDTQNDAGKNYIRNYGSAIASATRTTDDIGRQTLTITLAQLVGNVNLDLPIMRMSNSFPMYVGEGVYFGLAVPSTIDQIGNCQILNPKTNKYIQMIDYNRDFYDVLLNAKDFSFGINMFDDYLISTAKQQTGNVEPFDVSEIDLESGYYYPSGSNEPSGEGVWKQLIVYSYTDDAYYLYELAKSVNKDNGDVIYTQNLYLIEPLVDELTYDSSKYKIVDRLASIEFNQSIQSDRELGSAGSAFGDDNTEIADGSAVVVNYFTNAEFQLVFSTNTTEAQINNYQEGKEVLSFLYSENAGEYLNLYKLSYNFRDLTEGDDCILKGDGKDENLKFYNFSDIQNYLSSSAKKLKITQQKSTATFYIRFVDEEGNELLENRPTVKASIGGENVNKVVVGDSLQVDVNRISKIAFTIENNNYYQWKYRGGTLNLDLGRIGKTELNNQLYIDLSEDVGAAQGVKIPDGFAENVINGASGVGFSISEFGKTPPTTSTENNYNKSFNVTLDFDLLYAGGDGVTPLAFNYDLTFVLKQVDYKISVETKFRQNSNALDEDYYDDQDAAITTISSDNGEQGGEVNMTSDDSFTITSKANTSGYSFVGFRVVTKNSENKVIKSTKLDLDDANPQTLEMSLMDFVNSYQKDYEVYSDTDDEYTYTIQAIYQSEYVNFMASFSKFIIQNYNGTEAFRYNDTMIGSFETTNGILDNGTFYYYKGENASSSTDISNGEFVYTLNSSFNSKYYLKGFAIVVQEHYSSETFGVLDNGNTYSFRLFNDVDSSSFELTTNENGMQTLKVKGSSVVKYFQDCMSDPNFIADVNYKNKNYYIIPVVEQATLLVKLDSGLNGLDTSLTENAGKGVYNTNSTSELDETTNNVITFKYYYSNNINIDFTANLTMDTNPSENRKYTLVSTDVNDISIALNDYFGYRIGYTPAQNGGWEYLTSNGSKTPILMGTYRLDNLFFSSNYQYKPDADELNKPEYLKADYEVSISRRWQANTYNVYYSSGDSRNNSSIYGNSTGTVESITMAYDEPFEISKNENGYAITGYEFVGWNTQVDGNGVSYQAGESVINLKIGAEKSTISDLLVENGILVEDKIGRTLTLYAQWQAKEYQIKLVANGGSFTVGDNATEMYLGPITYNTQISGLADAGSSLVRNGYKFDGFYVYYENAEKNTANLVEDGDYLRSSIRSFNDIPYVENSDEVALVLYATWSFVGTTELNYLTTIEKQYIGSGKNIEITFGDLNEESFIDETGNLVVEILGDENSGYYLNITTPNFTYVNTKYSILGNEQVVASESNLIYIPSRVGSYYFTINIVFGDAYTADEGGVYNLGDNIYEYNLTINVNVSKANVGFVVDESVRLVNIKYLVSQIENKLISDTYSRFATFDEVASYIKSIDLSESVDASYLTNDQIYEYLFMKYFNMINSNDDQFREFRNWEYEDYYEYYGNTNYFAGDENLEEITDENVNILSRRNQRKNILQNITFLLSYDYQKTTKEVTICSNTDTSYGYNLNQVRLTSETVGDSVNNELLISSIVVSSNYTLTPSSSYRVKAYLSAVEGVASNYNLYSDAGGNFIYLNDAYMLVQVLRLKNNASIEKQATFFNNTLSYVNVEWTSEGQNEQVYIDNFREYYYPIDIDSNLYINLVVNTSNPGQEDVDTVFNFFDKTNYFDLSSYQIYLKDEEGYYINYSAYFNLILDESFEFTIYNIKNTSKIELQTAFLTKEDGYVISKDLEENLASELFNITGLTYSISGETKSIEITEDGKYFSSEEEGSILLMDIQGNNTGAPIFYTGGAVTSVNIQITSKNLSTFNRLYHVGNSKIYELSDDHNDSDLFTIDLTNIEFVEGEITDLVYYANYTDLVRVDYDMNLPVETTQYISYLQLGVDTQDEINMVTQANLKLSRLVYVEPNNNEIDYQNIFTGADGVYVGYLENNIYAPVKLKAYWTIDKISASSNNYTYTQSVGTLSEVYASNAGVIGSELMYELFDYHFEIVKDDVVISSSNDFNTLKVSFENGGTLKDNGTYKVNIIATIKDEFRYVLDEESETSVVTDDIEFVVDLKPIKIMGAEFIGENNITYDGLDHKLEFQIALSYQQYDTDLGDYDTESKTQTYQYGQSTVFNIQIYKDEELLTRLLDAGIYNIKVSPDLNYYDITEIEENSLQFVYTINKYNINLKDYEIKLSKQFNTRDEALTYSFNVNSETIVINMTRDAGEEVGDYGLYLETFTARDNENYRITFDDVVLYENEIYQNLETRIGTFTISVSGNLRVYWEVSEGVTKNLECVYNENGYKAVFENGKLVISSGDSTITSLNLVLYDVGTNERITDQTLLNTIYPLLNDIKVYLFNSNRYEIAYNVASYTFELELPNEGEILNYYQNVVFASDYTLQITSKVINVDEFDFSKTFDGTKEGYFNIEGGQIEDIELFKGVYIAVNYLDIHASESVMANLSLGSTTDSSLVNNYSLSNTRISTQIHKLKAEISFTFTQDEYSYGDINISNLEDNISYSVKGQNSEDLTSLFNDYSVYTFAFDLENEVNKTNLQGYFYAGDYTLKSTSTYQDFDMTEILPTISIVPYKYSIELPESYIVITVLDDIQSEYTENRILEETGDNFVVSYRPIGAVKGNIGKYDLELTNALCFEGNIEVSINAPNNAFEIAEATNTLYLELENPEILNQVYNAKTYSISTNASEFTLTVENEDVGFVTVSSKFNFYFYDDSGEKTYLENGTFSTIDIYYNDHITTFKDVGNYKLTLDAQSDLYSRVSFAENYYFTVTGKGIDVSTLTFEKEYDGTNTLILDNIEGVFEGDNVSLRAVFDNKNAGNDIGITLYLSGDQAKNYTLLNNRAVGNILKRNAEISLTQNSFMYGVVTNTYNFNFTLTSDLGNVSSQEFTASAVVMNGIYSGIYLVKGDYTLNITAQSTNYNIISNEITLHILPYEIDFNISTDGVYMTSAGSEESKSTTFTRDYSTPYGDTIQIEYTRSAGSAVGYYRILSANVLNNENYVCGEVKDTSANGGFRIVMSNDVLYLLASEEAEIEAGEEGIVLGLDYNGNSYDKVEILVSNEGYTLVLSNSQDSTQKVSYKLNLYSYDSASGIYTLTDVQDTSIVASAYIDTLKPIIQNVGDYSIYSGEVTSENFTIRLGKANNLSAFVVRVAPRKLYFQESTISKVFDNSQAIFNYDSSKDILTNFVGNDDVALRVVFYDADDEIAVYAGSGYRILATISGNDNYEIVNTMQDGTEVTGTISKAPLIITVGNISAIYGNKYSFTYDFRSETLDLSTYDTSKIQFSLSVLNPLYSSSNNLKVGEYRLDYEFNSNDFAIYMFECDGILQENLISTLTITQRELNLAEKDIPFEEIFTKKFDDNDTADIFNEDGILKFDLTNLIESDDVKVLSGTYAQKEVGSLIKVSFVLDGVDSENYIVKTYDFGEITPVIINLEFDYMAGSDNVTSNVDEAGLKTISTLSYPFVSNNYITENSADADTNKTRNFPTFLQGKTGATFSNWSLELSADVDTDEYNFLENLLTRTGNDYEYENGIFTIVVGNNAMTVSLLEGLVNDENDYFGFGYRTNDEIKFTFKAVWLGDVYSLNVKTQDANGEGSTEFAQVLVNDKLMTTDTEVQTVEYGKQVKIEVTNNAFVKLLGFYNERTGEEFVNGEGCTIVSEGDKTTFTIDSLSSSIFIVIKFSYADVTITMDLSSFSDPVTFADANFEEIANNIHVWSTNYEDIRSLYVSNLPILSRVGYSVESYIFNGETTIESDKFNNTLLSSVMKKTSSGDYEISYIPTFVGKNVEVTLDYGYDGITKVIEVPYQDKFSSSEDWEETLSRTGYTFLGWYYNDEQITGESVLTEDDSITLLAKWQALDNVVDLSIENGVLQSATSEYVENNGIYTFSNLKFDDVLDITITINEGYEIDKVYYTHGDDISQNDITFSVNTEGNVEISFKVIEPPTVHIKVIGKQKTNTVTVTGDHVEDFTAFVNDAEVPATGNTFEVLTDTQVKLVITMEEGYDFTDYTISDNEVKSTYSYADNILTIMLSSIKTSFEIQVNAVERTNKIHFAFDDEELVESVNLNGTKVETYDFDVLTGQDLTVYVKFVTGYSLNTATSSEFTVQANEIIDAGNTYYGYYEIKVSDIRKDGNVNITTKRTTYTLKVETIVYGDNQEIVAGSNNIALVNGQSEVSELYLTKVTLTAQVETLYSFAGWSKDGQEIFSTENPLTYEITTNETIYAIFSKLEFTINLKSFDHFNLYTEYNDPEKAQEIYEEIFTANFFEEDKETEITKLKLYYGASKTIYLEVPTGYMYEGFGYITASGDYQYIVKENSSERFIEIFISSFDFDVENSEVNLFVALSAYEAKINVSSWIDYDGIHEEDKRVGNIALVGSMGESVNRYGYVEGTRNHYHADSFVVGSGLVNNRDMTILSYTNNTLYLKIQATRVGYFFSNITADTAGVTIQVKDVNEDENGQYYIYQISNIVGGTNDINIQVFFKPQKNVTTINFVNENNDVVDGGNLHIEVASEYSNKVWADGTNFSSMKVTGFTDTKFSVVAYIRLGFMIDEENLKLTFDDALVKVDNIRTEKLMFEKTNYNYAIYFDVYDYADDNTISINLIPQTYTVLLKDQSLEEPLLVMIENVKYHETLDLSIENQENIKIYGEGIEYNDMMLNLVQTRKDYSFGGYFTYEGGKGVQYINSSGQSLINFMETGYIFDEVEKVYRLSENAYIDDNNNIVITLYLYWSYLKTQINFEIVPDIRINQTAQDIVQGVNLTNSWFNEVSPLYIEVAFNTNITFVAPEIAGYKFYKFVIKQKDINNNWLTDVVSYSSSVPWSTNEYDRIVEVNVQLVYFAKVDVQLYGGTLEYEITQDAEDNTARGLIREGYVDTTKDFTLTALPSEGYNFEYWQNISTGRRYTTTSFTTRINERTIFLLYSEGKSVNLLFDQYDKTNGQIVMLQVKDIFGSIKTHILGSLVNNQFIEALNKVEVKVGDTVTFITNIGFGYGVEFNLDEIKLSQITPQYYYFTMEISEKYANSSLQIIPTFVGESVAFYINQQFAEDEIISDALDGNNANNAGSIYYKDQMTTVVSDSINIDISIKVQLNARYKVVGVSVVLNSGVIYDAFDCYNGIDHTITFSSAYMHENSIAGTLILRISYARLYYGDEVISENGSGTEDDPYKIYSADDLAYYMNKINSGMVNNLGIRYQDANYIVMENIELGEKFWTPIGTVINPFNGTFNFNNHRISSIGLAVVYDVTSHGGLFGVIGENANIILTVTNYWYIYIIIGIVLLMLLILIILLVINRKRKKRREELNTK